MKSRKTGLKKAAIQTADTRMRPGPAIDVDIVGSGFISVVVVVFGVIVVSSSAVIGDDDDDNGDDDFNVHGHVHHGELRNTRLTATTTAVTRMWRKLLNVRLRAKGQDAQG